jgi:hypothetical protein
MGVSVYVNGIRAADGRLGEMAALKLQCDSLGISYPVELETYFKGTDALDMDVAEDIVVAATEMNLKYDLRIDGLVDGDPEYGDGMVIDLRKLPKDIIQLRVSMG